MQDELEILKERADKLGITYSPNIGLETLRQRINDKLNSEDTSDEELLKEISKLVRVIVTPMHSSKAELEGEIFTVSNKLGTFKKFVPFGLESGYHVPHIIYEAIKEKQVQVFTNQKVNGVTVRQGRLIPAYSVVVLPPLTTKELEDLAKAQQARQSVE